MVSFAYWIEGSANVGFFSDNTARTFINIYAVRPREEREKLEATYSRRVRTPNGVNSQRNTEISGTIDALSKVQRNSEKA